MLANEEYSTWWLLLRTVTPSITSAILCFMGGLAVTGLALFMLSINSGAFLPQLFEGEWAVFYTNTILQPVLVAVNNQAVSFGFVALAWAVFGLVVYFVGAGIIHTFKSVRDSQHETQMVSEYQYQAHPLEKTVIGQILWRLLLGVVMVGVAVLAHHTMSHVIARITQVFNGELPVGASIRVLVSSILFWAVTLQIYVILLRLYLLRTRVFGEILY